MLALCLCYTSFIVVVCISSQLIGFIHGPSSHNASVEQQLSFDKLPAIDNQDNYSAETADLVLEQYYKTAYTDDRALILRDAGIISALLAMIIVMFPNFTSTSYSNRLCFLLLILPLYLLPGLLGQILFQKSIPIEIWLITKSPSSGLKYIAYCSAKSLLVGMGES